MQRTEEQTTICSAFARGDNVMVDALAGCAKSTTLIEVLKDLDPKRSTCIVQFNVKTKKEMEDKIKAAGLARPNLFVKTMNGLGHQAIREARGKNLEVDSDKIYNLAKDTKLRGDDLADVMLLARQARMQGVIPKGTLGVPLVPDTDETWEQLCLEHDVDPILISTARNILTRSNKLALDGTIDYDDQLYISTLIFGKYQKFDTVLVDEGQDLNRMNHVQVQKSIRDQLGVVGDPHQAIYAWRGADVNSMGNIRSLRPTWTDCTLSVTFRCPRAVVERQRDFVPRFTAGPDNKQGVIRNLTEWSAVGGPSAAILCRNNAPLVRMAFRLIRMGVPVNYLGRDIGRDLKRLYNKISQKGSRSISQTIDELEFLIEKDPEKADRYDTLLAVLETQGSVDKAMEFFAKARTDAINLSTGHRAKGLEWDRVYHLEPRLIPSRYAQAIGGAALEQEANLRYVIETRTRDELFFVRSDGLQGD